MGQSVNNKKIIKVYVKGHNKPYSAFDKFYSRSFDEDKQLSPENLKALLNRDDEIDHIINKKASNQDLTFTQLKNLFTNKNIPINNKKFEENFKFYTEDKKYNYMAEILSDENDLSMKVVTFKGTDKTVMLKRTNYGGKCLFLSINNILEYMESINETKVKLSGITRKEEKYFNYECFKEAFLNACVHSKWSEEIPPAVYIFDDRIEIVSNGGLPDTLSKEDFFAGVSKPVNLKLLNIFEKLDYIEQTGHGVPLIVKTYGEEAFYISKHTIIVTIPINKEPLENDLNNFYDDLSTSELKVLNLIDKNNNIKTSTIVKSTKFSEAYINKIIRSLKEKKYLDRVGSKKNGSWKVL